MWKESMKVWKEIVKLWNCEIVKEIRKCENVKMWKEKNGGLTHFSLVCIDINSKCKM